MGRKEILKARVAEQCKALMDAWQLGDDMVHCDESGKEIARGKLQGFSCDSLEGGLVLNIDGQRPLGADCVYPASSKKEAWDALGTSDADVGPAPAPPVKVPADDAAVEEVTIP